MERLTSRQNRTIRYLRRLGRERAFRREQGQFLCDGEKLLDEALQNGVTPGIVLFREGAATRDLTGLEGVQIFSAPEEVFSFVSPLENSPGPVFSAPVRIPESEKPRRVIVLENLQDPGNVGTALRTAAALGCDLVALTGECADPWNPKTVRAAMGALFRQKLIELPLSELPSRLRAWDLPLYGAALAPDASDIRSLDLRRAVIAIGNEGHGLSAELLALCDQKIIIPMTPGSESLNAAVAASILMWEMARSD